MKTKISNIFKSKYSALIAAVIVAFAAIALTLFASVTPERANAETAGTVTVHVYDPLKEYNKLGGWFWVKGGSGTEFTISSSAAENEEFTKDDNSARTFEVTFSANSMSQLKSGTKMGLLICASTGKTGTDFWTRYVKETSDVFIDISTAFDENNHADVYYVRKDTEAYTDIEGAKMALEKITSARFASKTTVEFDTSSTIENGAKATLYKGETEIATANVKIDASGYSGSATFPNLSFEFSADYTLAVTNFLKRVSVAKTTLIDDVGFIKTYENADTQSLEYGAIYTKESTTFRVWAPFASSVMVNLFSNGNTGSAYSQIKMDKRIPEGGEWGGVWEAEIGGDRKGVYYTYLVNNYGSEVETIDPYAKACGINGKRGMVVDLKSASPAGWDQDKHLYASSNATYRKHADTPVVWEVCVKDFSASPDSGMVNKGKYLAFTETGTTVPGKRSLKTGVDYLKDLGITYVHLNPVYDFATIDESDRSIADNTKDTFNWGYDPQNYNIPEGSYATDASRGEVRIKEFKQMVMALHNAGIGVIMDVVYNHTYSTSGQALHDTVPFYYHRTDEKGAFTDGSGCGNETASERTMVRKYMVDSLVYWASEYHIDGFRFDLMGIHDRKTIEAIRDELDKLDGGEGKKILMYGEPWSADGKYIPASFANRLNSSKSGSGITGYAVNPSNNELIKSLFAGYDDENPLGRPGSNYPRQMGSLPARVAVFNDTGREGIRGNNDPGSGWINGSYEKAKMLNCIKKMMNGGLGSFGDWDGMSFSYGSQNVAYAAAHDNYPLWDQVIGKQGGKETPLYYDEAIAYHVTQCKLAASIYLTSSGIPFMLAGEEMGRTKYGNHNSYNSPTKVNQIVWARQEQFADLYNFYKAVITARVEYGDKLFSYEKFSTDPEYSKGDFYGSNNEDRLVFKRTQNGANLEVTLNNGATMSGAIKIGNKTITF